MNIRDAAPYQLLTTWAMGLIAVAAWLLQHPATSITHDSLLYTLFALVRLHPDTLGADVVVRFGSQDRFTFFTPIYAAAIQLLGMEHAAALLLAASEATFFACAWLLARRFMSRLDATLGLALLAAVPGEYGSGVMFHFLENFLTPRMPAEALVVAAVLAALSERYWIGAGCIVAAMLIHPIMGAAGAAFMLLCFLVPLRPRLTLTIAAVSYAIGLGAVLALAPLGRLMDPDWARALDAQVPYLFVSTWPLEDWSRIAVPLAALAIGWHTGSTPLLRRVCASALGMVACGMAITLIFADLLHVWLVISAQTWRWLWLADVLALLLAPAILQDCWQRSASGRVAVMVLAIAWVFRGLTADFLATALALALAAVPVGWGQRKYWRLLFAGACVVLGLGIVLALVDWFTYLPIGLRERGELLNEVRAVCSDGVVLLSVSALGWALLHRVQWRGRAHAATALILVVGSLCIWLTPYTWRSYTGVYYTPKLASQFAPWRAAIPTRAEVLWPDTALSAWYLLERPNYWSVHQVAGGLFSREQTIIMERRTDLVRTAMRNSGLLAASGSREEVELAQKTMLPTNVAHLDSKALRALCADPELQYVVSRATLARTPFPPITDLPSKTNSKLYLYRCADLRP